jgi:nicotinate-nucleotide adenylyltransferase
MEIDEPEQPYSVQTLTRLRSELPGSEIFFIIGADSWIDITTWHRWEEVLALCNHIVVTRPGFPISFDHVTPAIRQRIVDVRGKSEVPGKHDELKIFVTDAANIDVSATRIRQKIREQNGSWKTEVPEEVAKYIEKYQIYS